VPDKPLPFAPLPETTLSAVAAELAHRINSPLAALFASLEAVESGAEESNADALADLRSAALRIRAVVEHMTGQLVPSGTSQSGAPQTLLPQSPHSSGGSVVVRVLIVDDDPSVLRSLRRFLRDHEVVAMDDAAAALERILCGERFDLILSDLTMPHMNGMELERGIARIDAAQAERVVFMTGGATTDEARDFLASTRSTVLTKPFPAEALQALVRARAPGTARA
jgi:CheY-like chemotaxis protein